MVCCCLTSVKPLTRSPTPVSSTSYNFMVLKDLALLTWIKHFLSDQSQQVVLNNKQGDSCNAGVPQGTVLAPLLF